MSFFSHIAACNNYDPREFVPLSMDERPVGRVRPDFARRLLAFHDVFIGTPNDGVTLHPAIQGFERRTKALAEIIHELARQGVLQQPMGEPYPVTFGDRDRALCVIDRTAASWFGFSTFGQHLNGFVRRPDGIHMWIGRRARDRRLFPGRLDQLVAGGLPHGISLRDNLVKECFEEAGISRDLANKAQAVGTVSYFAQTSKGAKPDLLYCYDLELPDGFVPRCTDGEVESFSLMPVDEVMEIVRTSDEFKPNCSLVVLDFLIRHGLLRPTHAEHASVARGLQGQLS